MPLNGLTTPRYTTTPNQPAEPLRTITLDTKPSSQRSKHPTNSPNEFTPADKYCPKKRVYVLTGRTSSGDLEKGILEAEGREG
ncbi:hypothetical protein E2C01_036420 [Portunus trituberculatus]|uniref:Uncharacterized protein n=1 Tax=Portunus trituberculatus TaxID=210409 RepID=A0A5B7FC06_PORTR|nr:hypothetical protein [Portunus trituberculatus]